MVMLTFIIHTFRKNNNDSSDTENNEWLIIGPAVIYHFHFNTCTDVNKIRTILTVEVAEPTEITTAIIYY